MKAFHGFDLVSVHERLLLLIRGSERNRATETLNSDGWNGGSSIHRPLRLAQCVVLDAMKARVDVVDDIRTRKSLVPARFTGLDTVWERSQKVDA